MSSGSSLFRRSSVPTTKASESDESHDVQPSTPHPNTSITNPLGLGGKAKRECFVFEPQQWRRTVCKNCFRTQPEHKQTSGKEEIPGGPTVILRRADSFGQATTTSSTTSTTGQVGTDSSDGLLHEYKTVRDNGRSSATTLSGTAARAAARKVAVGQKSSDEYRTLQTTYPDSRRCPTNNSAGTQVTGGVYSSASSIDARYIEELENDFFALEDKHEATLRERDELVTELEAKIRSISDLHATLEQYREKVNHLERRCLHLEEEIKGYRERLRLPESDQSPTSPERIVSERRSDSPKSASSHVEAACSSELQQRLNEVEQLCQEVMEENEQLKEEVEEMQREIEEMHDHFQEDDRDAVRELQRDLEAANKTCRILQFKLRKAERRFDQCEAERANLEERLARLEAELYSEADVAHIRNLEEEVRVAKEVSMRLNNELDMMDEKRTFYEEENRQLKEELQACHNRRITVENELGRLRLETEKLKVEKGISDKGPLQVTDKNRARNTSSRPSLSREASFEEQQLQRELDSSREREADLSEQLRFAEEEIRKSKRRMKELRAENDMLTKKIERFFASQSRDAAQYNQLIGMNETSALNQTKGRFTSDASSDAQELENLRNQLNLIQDHLARIELERDQLQGENKRLRLNESDSRPDQETGTDMENLLQENDTLKRKLKELDRKLRALSREIVLVGSIERDNEWIEKYNDAKETIKEQESQLFRAKKRITELQDENTKLRADGKKTEQKARREREKGNTSPHLSREVLAQEVKTLEEELDDVTADLTAAREQACTAQLRVTYLEDNNTEMRTEAERRERELLSHLFHLHSKNELMQNLVHILQERADNLQTEMDRLLGIAQWEECAENQRGEQRGHVTEDDQVFRPHAKATSDSSEIKRQLRERITILEQQLREERRLREAVEQHLLKMTNDGGIGPAGSAENQLRTKQLDLLKKELEEKDEILESKDEQIADLKCRIEQSRKMNDALRALMEKDSGSDKQLESSVEITSYRKEIESARKEMQILRDNLHQAEKLRERLIKDNRELQEELKLREDSIFEQDDEIERRNAELRAVKANLEAMQRELDQTRRETSQVKSRESSGTSGRLSAQIAQNEQLRAELHETSRQLNELKLKYEDTKQAATANEEKFTQLSNDMDQLKVTLQEKDVIIVDLNRRLHQLTEEAGQSRLAGQNAQTEKMNLERQLVETKNALMIKEQEYAKLQSQMREASGSMRPGDRSASSQESGIGLSDNSAGRDGTLSRRSAEVDRLRRELSLIRRERDDLLDEIKHLRIKLEKQQAAYEQQKKESTGGLVGLPTGNAYAKAIAAQQTTTKINLLNEHIASLNRTNMELKLQNESLQNHMLDYQRRYRSLKEQYEGEQEAWLTERVVLESKAKEQEDRKLTIANTRKILHETTIRLLDLERASEKNIQELQSANENLLNEKNSLELKLGQLEEHQKLPKVLQRFGAATTSTRNGVLAAQTRGVSAGNMELMRRVEAAERTVAKLRAELNEVKSAKHAEQIAALEDAETAKHAAEQEAEDLRDRLLTMECYRQQAELFRHRHFEVEEGMEKEMKWWQEEREHLIYRAEEARVMVEQWLTQLQCRVDGDSEKADDVVADVVKQMDKWRNSRGKVPCLKRRMVDSLYNFDASAGPGSVPASPATSLTRNGLFSSSAITPLSGIRGHTQRSTSMEWGNGRSALASNSSTTGTSYGPHYRESSLGISGLSGPLRGSALSLATGAGIGGGSSYSLITANRCGRSVSPDVSVRKLSNYPDPTPGFLVRPTSQQGSHDSLSSIIDYTQHAFTLPGKPPMRSAISPARKRFFEDVPPLPPSVKVAVTQAAAESKRSGRDIESGSDRQPVSSTNATSSTDNSSRVGSPGVQRVRKGSSQPPPTTASISVTSSVISEQAKPSIADRFAKWSSPGSKSGSKTTLNETGKEGESLKAPNKKYERDGKSKTRDKSPKSPNGQKMLPKSSSKENKNENDQPKQSDASKSVTQNETEPERVTTPATKTVRRSGSVSTISPAIMALRQKFAGGSKP
ncbi:unnamed protein product [Dicrocoelium dendriticum]|nr:unnamed protein product [Dicrocoelium dendriticum]